MYIPVYKNRVTTIELRLGIDITGDTITSQVRVRDDPTSDLILTWTVTVISAATGVLELTYDDTAGALTHTEGFMDVKRVHAGDVLPVFDEPQPVKLIGAVTA